MAKKVKKKFYAMPKLGLADQILYWIIMIITGGGALFCLFYPSYYKDRLSSFDPDVLSWSHGKGSAHNLWLTLWLAFACVFVLNVFYQKRIPVFGRSDVRYGPPSYPRIYPLLMKNKPKPRKSDKILNAKSRAKKRIFYAVFAAAFFISAALFPLSLFGRTELLRDGTVIIYDPHNGQTAHYTADDMEAVFLDTHRSGGGRYGGGSWYARIKIYFSSGEHRDFSVISLADNWTDAIRAAEVLKENYGSLFYIQGTKNLWRVVRDSGMSSEEEYMLYLLFEAEPPSR